MRLISVLLPLTLACSLIPVSHSPTLRLKATTSPEILHFENEMVSFEYPAGLLVFNRIDPGFVTYPIGNELGGQLVVGLADPDEVLQTGQLLRTVSIFRYSNDTDLTMEEFMDACYKSVRRDKAITEVSGPVTLAGLPAFQQAYWTYDGVPYEMRDIWVQKDDLIFRVSIWTQYHNEDSFSTYQAMADQIVKSLKFKDMQPPYVQTTTPIPTLTPTPIPSDMLLHFENQYVAFDYPKDMVSFTNNDPAFVYYPDFKFGGEVIAGLGDPRFFKFNTYFRSIRITRLTIPQGSNLEVIFQEVYDRANKKLSLQTGVLDANGLLKINGWDGLQKTYRVYSGEPAYELRDIWFQKEKEILIISIWTEYTNAEDFSLFQGNSDAFLNSLVIK